MPSLPAIVQDLSRAVHSHGLELSVEELRDMARRVDGILVIRVMCYLSSWHIGDTHTHTDMYIYVYVYLSIYLSVYLSIYLYIYLCIYLSI